MTSSANAEPKGSEPSSSECQHPNKQYTGAYYDGPGGRRTWLYYTCPDCKAKLKEEEREEPAEPPLTPEEEEAAPCPHESWDVTSEWPEVTFEQTPTGKWWKSRRCNDCGEDLDNVLEDEPHWDLQPVEGPPCSEVEGCDGECCAKAPPPPQPGRRPPYAVAYSVQGHLYEVALPGDATVRAVDGALVIQHRLGPVAGIVQVLPVINEESNAG